MRILYYGQLKEIGAKICASLSEENDVTAVTDAECEYELECSQYLKADTDIGTLVESIRPETVLVYMPDGCDYREVYKLLRCCKLTGTAHAAVIVQAPFCRRLPLNADIEQMLCEEFTRQGMHAFVIVSSALYGGVTPPDYVTDLYAQIQKNGCFAAFDRDDYFCDAMHADDLCSFLKQEIETEFAGINTLVQVQSGYPFRLKQFIDAFSSWFPMAETVRIESGSAEQPFEPYYDGVWVTEHSFLKEAERCFTLAEDAYRKNGTRTGKRILPELGQLSVLLLAFAAIELYLHYVPVASDLQFVDLRLLLIICAGLFCGKRIGLAFALMCSVSSVIHCMLADVKWYIIFYHIDNWIPIAVYFVAAILIGSYHDAVKEAEVDKWSSF